MACKYLQFHQMAQQNIRPIANTEDEGQKTPTFTDDDDRKTPTFVCKKILTFVLVLLSTVLFLFIGPCLCFFGIGPRARILILWLWLTFLALFFGLSVRFLVFGGVKHFLAPLDQRPLTSRTLSLFCTGLEARSEIPVNLYRLEYYPTIASEDLSYQEQHELRENNNETLIFPFYFLRGSDVTVNVTSGEPLRFAFLRGEHSLERWLERLDAFKTVKIGKYFDFHYHFHDNEEASFIFISEKFDPGGEDVFDFSIMFSVMRTRVNLTNAEAKCKNAKFCHLNYRFNSAQTVVVDVPFFNRSGNLAADEKNIDISDNVRLPPQIHHVCVPNILVYLFLFFLVPISLGCLGSGVIYACHRRRNQMDEMSPLLEKHYRRESRKYSNVLLY